MSLSLHSSTEYLGGSNRWSRNDSDMVPEKSSIGRDLLEDLLEAGLLGHVLRPASRASSTRACQLSLPSSQSKDVGLQGEEVGDLERLVDLGEGDTAA